MEGYLNRSWLRIGACDVYLWKGNELSTSIKRGKLAGQLSTHKQLLSIDLWQQNLKIEICYISNFSCWLYECHTWFRTRGEEGSPCPCLISNSARRPADSQFRFGKLQTLGALNIYSCLNYLKILMFSILFFFVSKRKQIVNEAKFVLFL
jgi:hypothetical protein